MTDFLETAEFIDDDSDEEFEEEDEEVDVGARLSDLAARRSSGLRRERLDTEERSPPEG